MSRGRLSLERFWLSEWSLSALLAFLVIDGFVIGPLAELGVVPGVLPSVVFSLVILSGMEAALRSRRLGWLVAALVGVSLIVRWASHVYPSLALARAESAATLAWGIVLVGLVLTQVYRPGPINLHRVQGAIAVYLMLAYTWGQAYKMVALGDPGAFNISMAGLSTQSLSHRLSYFSVVTLTTVGYGDIVPVSPVARSLATLEALTGQLFPAVLLARLVSLELYHRQQRRDH
jgi:hypothetical protein